MTSENRPAALRGVFQLALGLLCAIPPLLLFFRGAADAAVVLIGLLFLSRSIVAKDWTWVRHADVLVLLAAWLSLNLLVSPFAEDSGRSYERSLAWIRFVLFYAAVTRWLLVDPRALKVIAATTLATIAVAASDAAIQLIAGHSPLSGQPMTHRLTGPLERPNIGMYLAKIGFAAIAMALAVEVSTQDRRPLISALLLVPLALTIILLSGERTASILTLVAAACGLVGLSLVSRPGMRVALTSGMLGSSAFGALLLFNERIAARAADLGSIVANYGESIYGELVLLGWRFFLENPFTGIGMGNYAESCPAALQQGLISDCHPHPHNIYVEWLAESGLAGTSLWLVFVALLVWHGLSRLRPGNRQAASAGLYLATLSISLFPVAATQSTFSNWPAILAWTSIACAVAALRATSASLDTGKDKK